MEREADVVIVGGGTSGTYLGWRLAERGFRCLVLEKSRLEELGKAIGPFHMEEEAFERFGIPLPEGGELLHRLETVTIWPPCMKGEVTARLVTLDMDKPAFMRRLISYAREAGAEVLEETEFSRGLEGEGAERRARSALPAGGGRLRHRGGGADALARHPVVRERLHSRHGRPGGIHGILGRA